MTNEPCAHTDTIAGQEWASEDDCRDVVTCLDCGAVVLSQPKGVSGSLLQRMEWLDG